MAKPLVLLVNTLLFFILIGGPIHAWSQAQTQRDSYTRYELLAPESHSFRIIYDVSATTSGNKYYYNTLRKGSEHEVTAVYDRMTGKALKWEIVDGAHAKANEHPTASEEYEYLKVYLARPIPEGGAARIRIDKTYKDAKSYYIDGDQIVFDRSLGIKRNAVVLPPGYELVTCNYPSQVQLEDSGRIKASYMNRGVAAVPYKITAKKLDSWEKASASNNNPMAWPDYKKQPSGRDKSRARLDFKINERAFQNRDIVYFLQQPETHDFRLYHDYTETREGVDKYINVVRAGSKASNPSAKVLDTGEELKVETLIGQEITNKGIELNGEITPETEIIVIWFDPVKKGQSVRLRIEETYTDANRYLLNGDELVWDRSFGRNRNTVVLPKGWFLTTNAIPAIIDQTADGLPRLYFMNDRPDNIDVFIKAKRKE